MGGGGEWNQELRQHPGEVPRSPGRFFLQVGVLAPEEFPESPSWAHSFSPASLNHPFSPLLSDFSLIRLSCPFFLFFKPLPVGFISSLSFLFPVRTVILAMDIREVTQCILLLQILSPRLLKADQALGRLFASDPGTRIVSRPGGWNCLFASCIYLP